MLSMEQRILVAIGDEPANLVLKNARILDVSSGEFQYGDIAISGDEIVGVYESYVGCCEIDLQRKAVVPGFIDGHRHVESNLTPRIAEAVLPRGVTSLVWDPHEMANVKGKLGIEYALAIAGQSAMDIFVNLPSCVPATPLGTSGAILAINDLLPYANHPKVIGLAELMDIGGVLGRVQEVLAKAKAFENIHIDGHLPGIHGKNLSGMIASGVTTDHESTTLEEAQEKLSKGVHVLARAGSAAQNIPTLAKLFKPFTAAHTGFCTDDRNPDDIEREGDIDYAIRTAIRHGADPVSAYIAASYGAAKAFGLTRRSEKFGAPRGAIAPGWKADLVVLDDVETCKIHSVYKNGERVTEATFAHRLIPDMKEALNTVLIKETCVEDFRITARNTDASSESRPAIGIIFGQIVTRPEILALPVANGFVEADPEQDVAKLVVMERHGINGNVGKGFIAGFGFNPGKWALASTVSHDDHNLVIAGTDDLSISVAANHLRKSGGGYVAVKDGRVIAALDLPLFGLMSAKSPSAVAQELRTLLKTTREALGGRLHDAFQTLAFLSLSVIPTRKLTDKGYTEFDPANGDQGPRLSSF
ncbi:MAG: adenine deaminase [Hyphomicrobium sp.]|jgi:adenine deaminase